MNDPGTFCISMAGYSYNEYGKSVTPTVSKSGNVYLGTQKEQGRLYFYLPILGDTWSKYNHGGSSYGRTSFLSMRDMNV